MVSDVSLGAPALTTAGPVAPTRKQQLESAFPGLTVLGQALETPDQKKQATKQAAALPGGRPLASGDTLLGAQQESGGSKQPGELSEEEKQQVAKLRQIDAKVRAHERAHAAVGGQYAGAPSYGYTRGPDGQLYAVSGEVSIDIGAENDPEATLQKAAQVAAAALAPADPSGADRAVAAAAQQLRMAALAQIREEKRAEQEAAAAEREEAAANAPALPGQPQDEGAADGAAPAAFGQPSGDQSGSDQSGRDGPAARAAQAYAPAGDTTRINREIGQLVGLVA